MIIRPGVKIIASSRPLARGCSGLKLDKRIRWASSPARQWSTPLAKTIAEAIATTGPISIAAYMRQCLTSPDGGYYTSQTQGKDQFGQKGDFITSPEISQIFGELLGIWLVTEWMSQGRVSHGVEVIEVGPGRGTLMDDMLRTLSNFKPLAASIESVYLVEASPALRDTQKQLLCGDVPLEEIDIGFRSTSKYSRVPVTWCEDIRFVPNDSSKTPFIFAHEFFDALPIHAFQSVAPNSTETSQFLTTPTGPLPLTKPASQSKTPQWRELVVTPTPSASNITTTTSPSTPKSQPDFQLSLAKASTPPSLLFPTLSQRYKALLPTPGSVVEISPESHSYAADFARRIGGSSAKASSNCTSSTMVKTRPSGAALILDYGPADTIPTNTLRGIRSHQHVSPLTDPGLVDISADVDFMALAEAALAASPAVEVHGPVEQGGWLQSMGIRERADIICKGLGEDEGGKKRVRGAIQRLVERGGGAMGKLYKVLAIVPERDGRRPVGFGGGVE
ncbi:hypothetical protein HO173_007951 [Letharia columbiana]|uniref:Protein arginine methyltransferase NDUFAF7 n=1 Tax=Letharia columbiana TaxID=112416 RepID=A0A8H6L341_9LECA|nr:uncharacterized protein HO173_007951 [Letharia columbiana]KAF6233739.1 hypothetical protein HO173_007951 [Letharia columbiana]